MQGNVTKNSQKFSHNARMVYQELLPIKVCLIDSSTNITIPKEHCDFHFSLPARNMCCHCCPKRSPTKNHNLIPSNCHPKTKKI